jgi:hypothetical protein
LQLIPHLALAHVAVPFAGTGHAVQEPQCLGSVCSLAQVPLQSVKPVSQPMEQVLAVHVAPPFEAPGHTFPHAPQLSTDDVVSTQPASSQSVSVPQRGPLSKPESSFDEASLAPSSPGVTFPSGPCPPSPPIDPSSTVFVAPSPPASLSTALLDELQPSMTAQTRYPRRRIIRAS